MQCEGLFRSNCNETELGSVNTATNATNRRDCLRQRNNYRNREVEFYGTEISDCRLIGRLSLKPHCTASKWFISVNNGKQSSIKVVTSVQGDDLLDKIYTTVCNALDIVSVANEPFIGCTSLTCHDCVTIINNLDVELIRNDYVYANSISNSTMSTTDTNYKKANTFFCKAVVEGIYTLCGSVGVDLYCLKGQVSTAAVLHPYKVSTEAIFNSGSSEALSSEQEMAARSGTSGAIGELTKNYFLFS